MDGSHQGIMLAMGQTRGIEPPGIAELRMHPRVPLRAVTLLRPSRLAPAGHAVQVAPYNRHLT